MHIVLDTNVLVSGVFWHGIPEKILNNWKLNKFQIFVSEKILNEYERVLYSISDGEYDDSVKKWLYLLSKNAHIVQSNEEIKICRDSNDNMFLECAIAANVQYIVSGDSDLLILKSSFSIPILTAKEFYQILEK